MKTNSMAVVIVALAAMLPLAALEANTVDRARLPEKFEIIPPDSIIPPAVARFSGIREGYWDNALHSYLIVKRILPAGGGVYRVDLIFAWGRYDLWGIERPGFWEIAGEISEEGGKFILAIKKDDKTVRYWFMPDGRLEGHYARPPVSTSAYFEKVK